MSHNSVKCGIQDSYGFLWFGTNSGLNRFDGNDNTIYRTVASDSTSLPNNHILCLAEDAGRDIWVGTNLGCYIYRRKRDDFVRFDRCTQYGVTIGCEVKKILVASDGRVWIGTLGQGFFIYDPQREELRQESRYLSFVSDFCESSSGEVYVSSQQGGLSCFDKEGHFLASYPFTGEGAHSCINSMNEVDGCLWMDVGGQQLYALNLHSKQWEAFSFRDEDFNVVNRLLAYDGQFLLAGTDNGLYFFDRQTHGFSRIDMPDDPRGLSDVCINTILRDSEEGIWILTESGGVNYIPWCARFFDYYKPEPSGRMPGKESQIVGPLCEGADGKIWIGTRGGLYCQDGPDGIPVEQLIEGKRYDIRALWHDGDALWIGTNGNGLIRMDLDNRTVRNYTYREDIPHSLCGNEVRSIYSTTNGELYVGTTYGLCRYLPETDNFFVENNIGYMVTVVDMHEDRNGILWLATAGNGVFRCLLHNRHWKQYVCRRGISSCLVSNDVVALFEDREGTMWFATNGGGLCSFDPATETFSNFDPENRLLPSQSVYAIEEDDAGNFWISGDAGLVRVHPHTKQEYCRFVEDDGLQENRFSPRSSLKLSSGSLYFGGINGFNVFLPGDFGDNGYVPPIYITGIHLQHADEQTEHELLRPARPFYLLKKLVLPYAYNSFILDFVALNYQDSHRNSYSYILHGVDKEQITGTGIHQAAYTNLPPGHYKFELYASNNGRRLNERGVVLDVVITPPWWRTNWAYCGYLFLVIVLLVCVAWGWYGYVHRKYHRRMEEFRSNQEKEIYKSKINFFVNLVHEIRTPLSLISLPLEMLAEKEHADAGSERLFSTIRRNVDYLLGITNELLDFQKMDSGRLSLKVTPVMLAQLVKDVTGQFTETAAASGVTLSLSLPPQDVEATVDKEKVEKILVNLLGNALKFTRSRISVALQSKGCQVEIRVIDDGDGLSDAERQHVFKPFYQAENARGVSGGTGLGLPFSRSLAQAHGGDLTLENLPEGGCCARLVLPIAVAGERAAGLADLAEGTTAASGGEVQQGSVADKAERQRRCTILFVEDNAELLALTVASLRQWYKVVKATNGVEALECLEREGVDVIVSDVMMPEMDGLELCRRVKENLNYSHIPVILLTAKTTLEAKVEGMESGADVYLEKPFAIKQLHRQIENILQLRLLFHRSMLKVAGTAAPATMTEDVPMQSVSQKDIEFIERINRVIEEALADEDFSIDNLAESLNMSRSNFYRKIKSLTGVSPNDYLKTLRLNRAAKLIKSGMRISEVYGSVGFSSSSYFAKCFKAQFGVLPKEYAYRQE